MDWLLCSNVYSKHTCILVDNNESTLAHYYDLRVIMVICLLNLPYGFSLQIDKHMNVTLSQSFCIISSTE